MLTRLTDAITKPQIHKYAFDHVLRMPRHEFLRGCRQAALATHDALQSALHDNDTELLDELPIAPPLHRELAREVRRGWEEGEPVLSMMRSRLEEQRRCLSRGHGLRRVRLICGARRSTAAALAGMHRLHLGSLLTVVDDQPGGLWVPARQQELLRERGCAVQYEVAFGGEGDEQRDWDAMTPPQVFLFEVSLDGEATARDADHDAQVVVADLNGITGGRVWDSASEVKGWWGPIDWS